MNLRLLSKRVVIVGILCIWLVKLVIRPYADLTETVRYGMGIAPNLIGSFLVPFAAYWLYTHPLLLNGRLMRFPFCSDPRFVCLFGFALGIINEYLQLIPVFGRTFDYNDIAFSSLGLVLSYYCFSSLLRRWSAA